MNRSIESETNPSTTQLHHYQRHSEVLSEQRTMFERLRNTIQNERNSLNLLSSVRTDIETHRAPRQTEEEYMLNERQRIDNSHNIADSILAQAYETREEFMRQRATLAGVQRKLTNALGRIPGINTVIAKVNTRKKRDSLILASLITFCVLLLLLLR